MLRSFNEFADMLEHQHADGPDEPSFESFWPDCPNPKCGQSMDEEQVHEVQQYECLNCRCEFLVEMLGGRPVFRVLSEPVL